MPVYHFDFTLPHLNKKKISIMATTSSQYPVIFVDDFTHYMWLYPIKLKLDIYSAFAKFKKFVECQFFCPTKADQTNLGC